MEIPFPDLREKRIRREETVKKLLLPWTEGECPSPGAADEWFMDASLALARQAAEEGEVGEQAFGNVMVGIARIHHLAVTGKAGESPWQRAIDGPGHEGVILVERDEVGCGDRGFAREGELLLVEMPVREELHVAVHRVVVAVAALHVELRRHVHVLAVDLARHRHRAVRTEGVGERIAVG